MRPPMPYSGGKQRVAEQIVELFPDHSTYVEPFAGALSVLLAKPPSFMEVVNDLNGDLVTFWRVLRDQPDDLERVCALTPHARDEYRAAADRDVPDELERARRVWVQLTQSRAALMRPTAGWRFVHGTNRMALSKYLTGYVGRIGPAAERLRDVSIENRPALEVIAAYGRPDALLYVDPPYLGEVRAGRQYVHELDGEDDHGELLTALLATEAKVVLSGYTYPLYDSLLTGWERVEMSTQNVMGAGRTEVLWMNFEAQPNLFSDEAAS